jgi:hypothetical protein
MATHFHALVRSRNGRLSASFERVLNAYVRRFNRQRKRDGSLFRGRFLSRRVTSRAYRRLLYRYIDDNPVAARVVDEAWHFPYGSARAYGQLEGPAWLERTWAESEAMAAAGTDSYSPELYRRHFPTRLPRAVHEFVDRRLRCRSPDADELDSLVGAAPERVREWMERKARLADGTRPSLPLVPARSLVDLLAAEQLSPQLLSRPRASSPGPMAVMAVGLLRTLCGLTIREIGLALNLTDSTVRRRIQRHHRAQIHEPAYAHRSSLLAADALRRLVE